MKDALAALPHLPQDEDGPLFSEPWQAQAFAMALALHERGLYTWPEWAAALSQQIQAAQAAGDPDLGDTCYRHWVAALEARSPPSRPAVPPSWRACEPRGTTPPTARNTASRSCCKTPISRLRDTEQNVVFPAASQQAAGNPLEMT